MSQQDKGQAEPSMEEILASIRRIIADDKEEDPPAEEEVAAAEAAPAPAAETPAPAAPTPAVAAPSPEPVAAPEPPAVAAQPEPVAEPAAPAEEIAEIVDTPPVEGAEEMELTEIIEDEPAPAPAPDATPDPLPELPPPNDDLAEAGRQAFLQETAAAEPIKTADPLPMTQALALADQPLLSDDERSILSPPVRAVSTNTLAELAGAIHARGFMLGNVAMTLEDLIRDLLRPHLKDWLDNNLPAIVERQVRAEIERMAREAEARKDLI